MKKVILIVLVLVVVIGGIAIFSSSSKEDSQSNENNAETVQDNTINVSEDIYYYADDEVEIKLGEVFNKEELGEEVSYSEIPSCAFDGTDKVYTYEEYEITTYEDGEEDKVYSIYFLTSNVETREGISVGDTLEDMIDSYGEDYEIIGSQYSYVKGNTSLDIIVEGETIISIQYTYIPD